MKREKYVKLFKNRKFIKDWDCVKFLEPLFCFDYCNGEIQCCNYYLGKVGNNIIVTCDDIVSILHSKYFDCDCVYPIDCEMKPLSSFDFQTQEDFEKELERLVINEVEK